MARRFGESFERPVDFYTGLPIPGAPEMARINSNRPGGSGIVVLRDPDPPPNPPYGANSPTGS